MNNALLIDKLISTFKFVSMGREYIGKSDLLTILLETNLKIYKEYILKLIDDMACIDDVPNYVYYEKEMENIEPYQEIKYTSKGNDDIDFLDFMHVLKNMVSFAETKYISQLK